MGTSEEPEAYQIGWVPFLGVELYLDSRPLIPRVETEWWVEQLTQHLYEKWGVRIEGRPERDWREAQQISSKKLCVSRDANTPLRVLDLCTGSGAIGCALLKEFSEAHVAFGEVDPAHEATIRKNIAYNHLDESRAEVRIGDLFELFAGEQFDIIAANPPYIPEARELPASVADYEPALALRAGADGLALIRRIATALPQHLARGGEAWIECDSEHAEAASELFRAQGFAARIMEDQYQRPRVIVVSSAD